MNVLWVTPYKPDAHGGGGVAHEFELLRLAARHHDIEVITADFPEDRVELDLGEQRVPIEGTAWRAHGPAHNKVTFAAQFLRARPSHEQWVLEDRVRALRRAVELHQRRRHVDLVHLTSTELASLVGACHATAVLLAFDVFSRHSRRERSLAVTRARRLRWAIEERRLARWERRWLPRFAGVAVVSDVDAAAIRELTPVVPDVIPNPVVDAFFAPPQVERSDRTVTLVANLGYRPNIDAVEWLGREIWPRVIDSVPDAELEVVGANPAPGVEGEIRRAGGRLSANVPDVRPYYWRAAVAVAPIRGGSGLRNKVLHAMACGAPIVATSTALEGIDAVSRRHLLVADDAAGFAAAIVETLHDREHAAQRTVAARELLDAHRSDAVGERFEAWWARSMTSPRVRPERG